MSCGNSVLRSVELRDASQNLQSTVLNYLFSLLDFLLLYLRFKSLFFNVQPDK